MNALDFDSSAFLNNHTKEVQMYILMGLKPAVIAGKFQNNFGVEEDPKVIPVPPVSDLDSHATDAPYPTKCRSMQCMMKKLPI